MTKIMWFFHWLSVPHVMVRIIGILVLFNTAGVVVATIALNEASAGRHDLVVEQRRQQAAIKRLKALEQPSVLADRRAIMRRIRRLTRHEVRELIDRLLRNASPAQRHRALELIRRVRSGRISAPRSVTPRAGPRRRPTRTRRSPGGRQRPVTAPAPVVRPAPPPAEPPPARPTPLVGLPDLPSIDPDGAGPLPPIDLSQLPPLFRLSGK